MSDLSWRGGSAVDSTLQHSQHNVVVSTVESNDLGVLFVRQAGRGARDSRRWRRGGQNSMRSSIESVVRLNNQLAKVR